MHKYLKMLLDEAIGPADPCTQTIQVLLSGILMATLIFWRSFNRLSELIIRSYDMLSSLEISKNGTRSDMHLNNTYSTTKFSFRKIPKQILKAAFALWLL